ncbi:hypothetical protein DM02DRAFT_235540 [Periconia macrospinosa]|uniref:Uncharacterized protein n=1 Tax=Periconia macrospinosa TaxID=97972 RepID=A0A2V1EBI4_9PLEO|nr:hypothetical protein DM02DRAFT_235540 [Periconia macrospinosa]
MQFARAHKLSVVPAALLALFSFLCIILTSVYWILTDWVVSRFVQIPSTHKDKDKWPTNDVIVDWTEASTNATIVSGCLNLFAACVALVAWKRLMNQELNTDFNAPLRRFYFISVYITGVIGSISALAALILHFTDKGDNEWSCITHTGYTFQSPQKGVPFDNLLCSREHGACNFLATHAKPDQRGSANAACNTAVAVKWFQLILILCGCTTMVLFFFQAKLRRHVRWSLHSNAPKDGTLQKWS